MLNFLNRPQQRQPNIREALVRSGLPNAADPTRIALLETYGSYVGRRVKFFRAVDAEHSGVQLGSGHVEPNGMVIVNLRQSPEGPPPLRYLADRTMHADDERLVFWDPSTARESEAALSAPAATWLRARATDRQ
jgi:hypothetical protein